MRAVSKIFKILWAIDSVVPEQWFWSHQFPLFCACFSGSRKKGTLCHVCHIYRHRWFVFDGSFSCYLPVRAPCISCLGYQLAIEKKLSTWAPLKKKQCITPTNRLGARLHLTHCSIQYCFAQTYLYIYIYSLSCFTVLYSYLASFTGLLTSNRLQHTRVRSTGRQVHPGSWVPWYSPNFWTTPISPVLRFNKTGEVRDEGVSIGKHIRS